MPVPVRPPDFLTLLVSPIRLMIERFRKKPIRLKQEVGERLYFAYYNFVRTHRAVHVTPMMEAGLTDHVWELRELLA